MDPLLDFTLRMSIFLAIFLLMSYFLFRHINHIRALYGDPKEEKNLMLILKHFFRKK